MATILLRTANSISHTGATVKGTPLTNSEVDNNFSNINIALGVLSSLTTGATSNIVVAINSLNSNIHSNVGVLTSLQTTDKSNVVSAINEVRSTAANAATTAANAATTAAVTSSSIVFAIALG